MKELKTSWETIIIINISIIKFLNVGIYNQSVTVFDNKTV